MLQLANQVFGESLRREIGLLAASKGEVPAGAAPGIAVVPGVGERGPDLGFSDLFIFENAVDAGSAAPINEAAEGCQGGVLVEVMREEEAGESGWLVE